MNKYDYENSKLHLLEPSNFPVQNNLLIQSEGKFTWKIQ